jgi:hypothetical protein
MNVDYGLAMGYLYPGCEWSMSGNDYATLVIEDDTPKPSQAELDAAWPQVQHDREVARLRAERHAAYGAPDGPDAIYLQWQRGDATEQDWLDAVQAVKDAQPYPDPV